MRVARWLVRALVCVLPIAAAAQVFEIRVLEGDGAVHGPGSRSARPLTVAVTDEMGKPLAGAAVSFQLPADGPGGTFSNGLRTDVAVSDDRGIAAARMLFLNRSQGPFGIRITVAKDNIRAGAVSRQYISDSKSAAVPHAGTPVEMRKPRSGWWKLAVIAGAAAAGGAALGLRGGGGSTAAAKAPAGISIGPPVITVGAP